MKRSEDIIPFPGKKTPGMVPEFSGHSLLRALADTFFRNWLWIGALWAVATLAVGGYAYFTPREYESEMTFLVRNNRADTVISAEGSSLSPMRQSDISDAQIS